MKRAGICVLLWLLATCPVVAKDEPVVIDVPNAGAHASELRVIEHALEGLSGDFAVRSPQGTEVPAAWDNKAKKLRFLAAVPAGGGKFTLHRGVKPRAKLPAWKKAKFDKSELEVAKGKRIDWVGATLDNGLIRAEVLREKTLHGRVKLSTLKGAYALHIAPLGASAGCVMSQEIAKEVEEDYKRGNKTHPELFYIAPSLPTKVEVLEPNAFERVVKVTCHAFARKNDQERLDLFEHVGYELTLVWNSPVVRIKTTRKLKTTYFNHNGVNLNEIYIDALPVGYASDGGEMADLKLEPGANVRDLDFERAMLLRDKTGSTAIMQPDFKKLAIYRACVVLASDRILTVLSQSWHEGWKAIEIKAGEYIDTMTLACNVGASPKSVKDWEIELAPKSE